MDQEEVVRVRRREAIAACNELGVPELDYVAGFWKRTFAFLIDVLPIIMLIAGSFYLFSDFRETVDTYLADPKNIYTRNLFLSERNYLRNLTKMVSIVPAFIGCLACIFNVERRDWHDRLAKTLVINQKFKSIYSEDN